MKPYIHQVQYYETDRMGITHHSNYIRWMEEARVAFLEELGWGYVPLLPHVECADAGGGCGRNVLPLLPEQGGLSFDAEKAVSGIRQGTERAEWRLRSAGWNR